MSLLAALQGDYTPPRTGQIKLSADDVNDIRRMYYHEDWSQVQLAEMFGVSQPQISKIVNKLQWKDPQ